jgi:radical SAM superfamily enzyme YgiQ (UPF0313 family)
MIYILNDTPELVPIRSIGAYRIASALRFYGYEAEVIDFISAWDPQEILDYIDSGPTPLWIGLSTTFMGYSEFINNRSRTIKNYEGTTDVTRLGPAEQDFFCQLRQRAPLVIGGGRTDYVKYIVDADYYLNGYGDQAVLALSDSLSGKGPKIKYNLQELVTEGPVPKKVIRRIIDCQSLYPVNSVENISTRFVDNDFIQQGEILPIEVGRGCIFNCAYCNFPLNGKKKNDYIRPLEQIKNDIVDLQAAYNSSQYLIVDDTFNDNIDKLKSMRDIYLSLDRSYEFWAYGRLDLLAKPEALELLPDLGWKYTLLGIETFNKASGSSIGKGLDPNKQKEALAKIKNMLPEFHIGIELIIGLPKEDELSIRQTANWLVENSHLWNHINSKPLFIAKPHYLTWMGDLTKFPEKYGYRINDSDNPFFKRIYFWENDHMNFSKAAALNTEVSSKFSETKLSPTFLSMMTKSTNMTSQDFYQLFKNADNSRFLYKSKKLQLRNLLPRSQRSVAKSLTIVVGPRDSITDLFFDFLVLEGLRPSKWLRKILDTYAYENSQGFEYASFVTYDDNIEKLQQKFPNHKIVQITDRETLTHNDSVYYVDITKLNDLNYLKNVHYKIYNSQPCQSSIEFLQYINI